MSIYKRDFHETKCMCCLIKDEFFFDKYNDIWEKLSNIIKKEFNSDFVSLYIIKNI